MKFQKFQKLWDKISQEVNKERFAEEEKCKFCGNSYKEGCSGSCCMDNEEPK